MCVCICTYVCKLYALHILFHATCYLFSPVTSSLPSSGPAPKRKLTGDAKYHDRELTEMTKACMYTHLSMRQLTCKHRCGEASLRATLS